MALPGILQWLLMNMVQHPDTKEVGWRHNLDAIQANFGASQTIEGWRSIGADKTFFVDTWPIFLQIPEIASS